MAKKIAQFKNQVQDFDVFLDQSFSLNLIGVKTISKSRKSHLGGVSTYTFQVFNHIKWLDKSSKIYLTIEVDYPMVQFYFREVNMGRVIQ